MYGAHIMAQATKFLFLDAIPFSTFINFFQHLSIIWLYLVFKIFERKYLKNNNNNKIKFKFKINKLFLFIISNLFQLF